MVLEAQVDLGVLEDSEASVVVPAVAVDAEALAEAVLVACAVACPIPATNTH